MAIWKWEEFSRCDKFLHDTGRVDDTLANGDYLDGDCEQVNHLSIYPTTKVNSVFHLSGIAKSST